MTQIRVFTTYRSVSIPMLEPGLYAANDPRLKGRAAYLVENGHAEWVDAPPTVYEADAILYGETIPGEVGETEPDVEYEDLPEGFEDSRNMDDEKAALRDQLDALNIEYDRRWGVERLREALEGATNG